MSDNRIPEQRCPACRKKVTTAGNFQDNYRPAPGTACICSYCLAVNIFTDGLILRPADSTELAELEADPIFRQVLDAVTRMARARKAAFN